MVHTILVKIGCDGDLQRLFIFVKEPCENGGLKLRDSRRETRRNSSRSLFNSRQEDDGTWSGGISGYGVESEPMRCDWLGETYGSDLISDRDKLWACVVQDESLCSECDEEQGDGESGDCRIEGEFGCCGASSTEKVSEAEICDEMQEVCEREGVIGKEVSRCET